jgi:hypothetical protein
MTSSNIVLSWRIHCCTPGEWFFDKRSTTSNTRLVASHSPVFAVHKLEDEPCHTRREGAGFVLKFALHGGQEVIDGVQGLEATEHAQLVGSVVHTLRGQVLEQFELSREAICWVPAGA